MNYSRNIAFVIMGVSSAGKTTVGKLLSQKTNILFFDADDFHSKENIDKMKSGKALTDEDRNDWLYQLNSLLLNQLQNSSCILACSVLKQSYRNVLSENCSSQIKFIHLNGSFEQILLHVHSKKNYILHPSLLKSQFDILENPANAINIPIDKTAEEITDEIYHQLFNKSELGIIGLGVMGKCLCRNFARNGFNISMFNRHVKDVEEDVANNFKKEFSELNNALAFDDIEKFIQSLQTPRKIILMVNAGKATDDVIERITPLLSADDVIVDGGNSFFEDTKKRQYFFNKKEIFFIGSGISGGEEGALWGPSIMPSGNKIGYEIIQPFLEKIAAKDIHQKPCCTYIGTDGSGHFVKMIHNGIEYVEMQLLAELYQIFLHNNQSPDEIASIFQSWKKENVDSYLLDITIDILNEKENNDWLINKIADKAQSKGTGNWASVEITKQNIPATLITTALYARYISDYKNLRTELNKIIPPKTKSESSINNNILLNAYELARIINHFQGFWTITEAFKNFGWQTDLSEIARIWTNGCIIRSSLMQELVDVFKTTDNLFLSDIFNKKILQLKPALSKTVSYCIENDIAIPCFSEAVNFLNAITTANSSANLIQAQRDYFGAHTFQRNDSSDEKFFHHHWKKSNDSI